MFAPSILFSKCTLDIQYKPSAGSTDQYVQEIVHYKVIRQNGMLCFRLASVYCR